MRKTSKVVFGLLATSLLGLSACNKGSGITPDPKSPEMGCYTYMDYTSVSPSNWNELTYKDNNDTQIMNLISGSFFSFDYEFDAKGNIVDGGFTVNYDAVKKLVDVTSVYAGDSRYNVPATATKDYAYKLTLRDDLKWDDGTEIHAADFVYTMSEQLNPLFRNYRADSFYNGSTNIAHAKERAYSGVEGFFAAHGVYELSDYSPALDDKLTFLGYGNKIGDEEIMEDSSFLTAGYSYGASKNYYKLGGTAAIAWQFGAFGDIEIASADDIEAKLLPISKALHGKTFAEIKADETLKGYWDEMIGVWQTDPGEELDFFLAVAKNPVTEFDKVGLFVGDNKDEIVMVLDKPLDLFKEDGSLSYKAAYNLSSLPLVKRDLYEQCKVEPTSEGGLWTSKYNSSLETSASWGPYKLTSFQAGKQYIAERNKECYRYNMEEYEGQYQTDRVVCNTIAEWNTAWLAFQQGDVTSIGIDVSISQDYKSSSRAVFTADDFITSMQLQSDADALHDRESAGIDKEMLKYQDFRKALSLAIDRKDMAAKCTTASQAGFGLFNEMHYYDVANAGVYRHEDVAKQVICDVYEVNVSDYDDLDQAYNSVTGYNLEKARVLVDAAYDAALAAGTISASDKVVLTVGSSIDSESTRRTFNYIKSSFEKLAEGTKLEGRLTCDFDASFGDKWADEFRAGAYDICTGGWTGGAWDPGYFLLAYLDPNYMYSTAWDTSTETLTFNPYDDGDPTHEFEMTLIEWYKCLNGSNGAKYNWSEGYAPTEFRLRIIAALEKVILGHYYTVPLYNFYSAALLCYKVDYISTTYNTFMAYGGLRYMKYRYDDLAWAYIKGLFDYKK